VTTEQLIKQFRAHYARIIHMSALTEGKTSVFFGSYFSMDGKVYPGMNMYKMFIGRFN
jgi:hypothetical protein